MTDQQPTSSVPTGALPTETLLQQRYSIKQRLGKGGMGAVYLAHDQRLEIDCALKEMSTSLLQTEEERERARRAFHEEAKLLARLNHPNLPRVTDHFSEDGKEYLVMEYVPGETLADILRRSPPPWPINAVMDVTRSLTEVLHYLHSRTPPIIFRDLKPSNVMRTPEGQIKLIDFGIARLFKPGQSHDTQAFGTMGYSAPEQYGKGQTDARSDVYSLAVMVHQLLTGHDPVQRPFHIPPAAHLNPQVPEPISAALQAAIDMEPEHRFGSMPALWRAMSSTTGGLSNQPFVAPPRQPAQVHPAAYHPSTPQQGYAPSTPQQGYAPSTPQQPYNAPSMPQQGYQPPAPSQYAPPPVQAPLYVPPYSGPQAESTGLARASMYVGGATLIATLTGLIVPTTRGNEGVAAMMTLLALALCAATFILSIVALISKKTLLTLKGRSHAAIGMALFGITLVLLCVMLVRYGNAY